MSVRGGIYEGPGGQKLYGDGREVSPVKSLDSLEKDIRHMTAPTKGPYEVLEAVLPEIQSHWEAAVMADNGWIQVGAGVGRTREEAEANAQLFAAAWELKKCAEEVAGTRDETIKEAPAMWLSQLVHMARTALAKCEAPGCAPRIDQRNQ
jgi:hypothetical protein